MQRHGRRHTKKMSTILGIYDKITNEIINTFQVRESGFQVLNIHGNHLSGKTTVAREAFRRLGNSYDVVSLTDISNDGPVSFVKNLAAIDDAIFTEYDLLHKSFLTALMDAVISIKLRSESTAKRWIISSSKPLEFASHRIALPDLSSDAATHRKLCHAMVEGFSVESLCPLETLFVESSQLLSVGQLTTLVKMAKSMALGRRESLSCAHLSRAFHALCYPASHVSANPAQTGDHVCEFSQSLSRNERLESFIGMTPDNSETVSSYLSDDSHRSKLLLVSGPIGCGKSYLAQAIAWNSTQPTVRVTSADILRSKIGETEKTLWSVLSDNKRVIIEDIDKLVPVDSSDATGSVQRCCSVIAAFLDKLRFENITDRMVVATTREAVSSVLDTKIIRVNLSNRLSFEDKLAFIKSEYPQFDSASVTAFDLINLGNRSKCIQFANELKMRLLREAIAN